MMYSTAVISSSATLAVIIPPSIPMLLYAVIAAVVGVRNVETDPARVVLAPQVGGALALCVPPGGMR